MNERKKLMPEQFSTVDNNMSLEKILRAHESKEPIVGKIVLWNSLQNQFHVDLGNGIFATLPTGDSSIYPALLPDGKLTASLRAIIGKPVMVTVKSVDICGKMPVITLSRKEIMLDAFNIISNSIGELIECCVTSNSSFGSFVDVGNGVSGLIHVQELCISRIENPYVIGIKEGDKITAKILSVDDKFHVNLNYKDQFENEAFSLNPGDLIVATVLHQVNNDGYYAYLNPNTTAILNPPRRYKIDIPYGAKVTAKVRNFNPNHPDKLRLQFVSFCY